MRSSRLPADWLTTVPDLLAARPELTGLGLTDVLVAVTG